MSECKISSVKGICGKHNTKKNKEKEYKKLLLCK